MYAIRSYYVSTIIDYGAGLALGASASPRRRRAIVAASVVANLSILGFFKYFHFALGSWNGLARWLGIEAATVETTLSVVLPLGISFYTFQSMSYSIDVHRGRSAAMRDFVGFACYVSMFSYNFV